MMYYRDILLLIIPLTIAINAFLFILKLIILSSISLGYYFLVCIFINP